MLYFLYYYLFGIAITVIMFPKVKATNNEKLFAIVVGALLMPLLFVLDFWNKLGRIFDDEANI